MIFSADDEVGQPDDFLLDLSLRAIERARHASMDHVVSRMKIPPCYPDVWPGEHYKLLAGIVQEIKPQIIVEIGTSTGLSALAITKFLPPGSKLVTFDIIPWREFQDTVLTDTEFADGRLTQIIGDLSEPTEFAKHARLIDEAEIIFADGPKDGVFEGRLLERLGMCRFATAPLVVLDDIRVWNMLRTWRKINRPKLDLTSFGHWSGTGLVHWIG